MESKSLPFSGIKVISFAWGLVGPMIVKYLADYGATLVRVESIKRLDITRISAPYKDGIPGVNRSNYPYFHANELSFALDLASAEGKKVAHKLVAWSDVVAESFSAGVMEKLGLGYEELKKIKPDIIMIRTCNQGQTGPHAHHPGFGLQLMGLSGFPEINGWPDRPPLPTAIAYTDVLAPRLGATALIAALDYHQKTGKGFCLDLSQLEASTYFMGPLFLHYFVNGEIATRAGNSSPCAAPHGVYRCKGEDRWCAIAVFTDKQWTGFRNALENPPWTRDQKYSSLKNRQGNEAALNTFVEQWTISRTPEEVMERMQNHGVPSGIAKNPKDILEDPQLALRNTFWKAEHPEGGIISHLGQLGLLSKTPARLRMRSPRLGEHTELVCREFLNMSDEEFIELMSRGVFQ